MPAPANTRAWVGPAGHPQRHRGEPGWRSLHLKEREEKGGGQHGSWSGKENCDWHVFNTGWQEEAEGMN